MVQLLREPIHRTSDQRRPPFQSAFEDSPFEPLRSERFEEEITVDADRLLALYSTTSALAIVRVRSARRFSLRPVASSTVHTASCPNAEEEPMADHIAVAETEIDASPEDVWAALTDPKEIEKYMFGSHVQTDWELGSPITWKGEYEGKEFDDHGRILEIERPRRLKVTHFSPMTGKMDLPENYHTILYELEEDGCDDYGQVEPGQQRECRRGRALTVQLGKDAVRAEGSRRTPVRNHDFGVSMTDKPTLYVCHGDDGGPRFHPCRRVQEALRAAGIEYEKVIAAHGSPIPFLRRGSRDQLFQATGTKKLPTLKLPDGTIIIHSRAILTWVREQQQRGDALKRVA